MRKVIVLVAVVASVCSAAYAQRNQTVSFFLSDINQTATDRQYEQWPSGFGVAYERMFPSRWSVQAAVAVEHHYSYDYVIVGDGVIMLIERKHLQTVPIDLTARYNWQNETRWKPYIGIGAHYVAAPSADARFRYRNRLDGEINGGTLFMLTPAFGLMLDGRAFVGDQEPYEQSLKVSFGASWRF